MDEGVLAGFPLLDVKVTLYDGAFHAVDSSAVAFETAARGAYRHVIGDLNRRRGMIKSQEPAPTGVRVKADVPLSDMFGYIGDLRTMTSGRGQFSMEFEHYMPCPKNVADEVIKEVNERRAAK